MSMELLASMASLYRGDVVARAAREWLEGAGRALPRAQTERSSRLAPGGRRRADSRTGDGPDAGSSDAVGGTPEGFLALDA